MLPPLLESLIPAAAVGASYREYGDRHRIHPAADHTRRDSDAGDVKENSPIWARLIPGFHGRAAAVTRQERPDRYGQDFSV